MASKAKQSRMEPKSITRKPVHTRREELIDAGIRALAAGGIAGFTIDKICRQAGVSRGLINHHFTSKDELLISMYARMTAYLVRKRGQMPAGDYVCANIAESFNEATFNRANLRAWLAIWGDVATNPALKAFHERRYREYRKRLTDALRDVAHEHGASIDPVSTARRLIALVDGLWLECCLHSKRFSLVAAQDDCLQFLNAEFGSKIFSFQR